jgi:hypothetical protein
VLHTLIGWLAILGGLIRMIASVSAQRFAGNSAALLASIMAENRARAFSPAFPAQKTARG